MSGPILLVDAYNVFARSFCVNPAMSSHGYHIGGSIGFLKSLGMYARIFRPSKIVICWEGGGSARRRKILPEYKMNRKPIKLNRAKIYDDIPDTVENFNYQIELLTRVLTTVPVEQMYVPECEADDIIGYLAKYTWPKEEVIIISMDQDMHQLITKNVKQWTPSTKKMLDENYVLERYGISVENFVTARSFIGDTSDGIPGIKGAGFKSLVKRFPELRSTEFVSVDDILKLCEKRNQEKSIKLFSNILNAPEVPKRNWKLMYLDTSNLSAEHIRRLKQSVENSSSQRNKLEFMKFLI